MATNPSEIMVGINAEWARTHANNVMSERLVEQLKLILAQIEVSAKRNGFYIEVPNIDGLVQDELRKRGFKVEYNSVQTTDPRETSYHIIKW